MSDKLIYIRPDGKLSLSRLHPQQKDFIRSVRLSSGITGGYQSGKSAAATIKCITKLLINPHVPVAYYLPTYGLIDDMLLLKFDELFNDIGWQYLHHKKDSKLITPYGEIWMRSMAEPKRIVSYSVGYSLVDEVDLVHPNIRKEVMQRISSRNSYKKDTINSIDFVSTPEGFAYMYQFFVKKAKDNKALFQLRTDDNAANLGMGYIEGLEEQYDDAQLKAYKDGDFVNLTSGVVYKSFDRFKNHSPEVEELGEVLHVGMDFNIENMPAVVHVVRHDTPIAVAELTGIYDTQEMCDRLREKYPDHSIVVYPDASGKNRSTSGKSDVELLDEDGFTVNVPGTNPFVKDRVNAMNRMFHNTRTGERRYLVNTDRCPEYTEALEKQGYKNGAPDKTTGFDHVLDAGGYFIHYRYPITGFGGGAAVVPFGE